MIDGASELSPIGRAASVMAPEAVSTPVRAAIPVILRATEAESIGARMRIGGMRVVDRAIRQLARLRDARVIVVSDDSIRLPRRLPPNIELREIAGDVEPALAALKEELGPETTSVGADTVWLQPGRFEKAIRVVDGASCRAAANSVYADLQRDAIGIFDRIINRKISTFLTRLLFANLPVTPALLTLLAGFVGVYGALLVASGTAPDVVIGFAVLQGYVVLDGCAAVLARVRLYQSGWAPGSTR